jgi:tetratricopeptide (TPR) repeat protein
MASTSDAEAHKAQGNAHFSSGKYAEAVACYSKAIEAADPAKNARNCAIYYTNRSAAYYALKQLSNALDDATKAYKIDPTWAKALWRQSAAYTALSKPREALAAVSKARSLSGPSVDPGILADFKSCSLTYIGASIILQLPYKTYKPAFSLTRIDLASFSRLLQNSDSIGPCTSPLDR